MKVSWMDRLLDWSVSTRLGAAMPAILATAALIISLTAVAMELAK